MYEKDYKGEYLSSAYESETLITFRRGENRDGNPVILAMYTERHLVKVAGNESPCNKRKDHVPFILEQLSK
ncbi:MAG: hypothetical protein UR99_C0032G0016, partial [Candidatus Moranbacteria bacterium GW2011_GWD2_36_12]